MVATIQLVLALGFGRNAIIADAVVTTAVLTVAGVLIARTRRAQTVSPAQVVAQAELIVHEAAAERQPA